MMQKTQMVLKAWLARCPTDERDALERFLSESERVDLEKLALPDEMAPDTCLVGGAFDKIHWSWFIPTLKTYAPQDVQLFLSAFDFHAAEQLGSSLNIPAAAQPVTEMGKAYLQDLLARSLTENHEPILPAEFFPASPLNQLVALSKKELTDLINLLSLYDLCAELRQIVETKILKKIYGFLSPEHRAALKTISAQTPETHPFPRMGLDRGWDGTEESLYVQLHRRGLIRLGIALCGQNPDLIWTICHHLDVGRGGSLAKLCGKEQVTGISEIAINQVVTSLQLLSDKG